MTASSSTIKAIKQVAHKKGWLLQYRLSHPRWKNDKVFVECNIEIPTQLMEKFPEIFSIVETLTEASRSDRALDQGAKEVSEGEDDEEVGDGLEVWDE